LRRRPGPYPIRFPKPTPNLAKSSQIQPNPAKPGQNLSKEKALISFDSLVHFEPFQGVALTPQGFFLYRP
jgi:hypothetical protein